jgi:L-threonylcarbamoyladenylate synthase
MVIYRPGAVTAEQIRAVAGTVEIFAGGELREVPRESLPSPGVGIRHYAPRARLVLVDAPFGEIETRLAELAQRWAGEPVGVMLPAEVGAPVGVQVFKWGRWDAAEELARELYAGLRALDGKGCTVILCPLPPAEGIGAAIRDRLGKAGDRD